MKFLVGIFLILSFLWVPIANAVDQNLDSIQVKQSNNSNELPENFDDREEVDAECEGEDEFIHPLSFQILALQAEQTLDGLCHKYKPPFLERDLRPPKA